MDIVREQFKWTLGFWLILLNEWLENTRTFFLCFLYSSHLEQSSSVLWKNLLKIEAWIVAEYFPSWVCS